MAGDPVVLLTGGTGAIGAPLARALEREAAEVLILSRAANGRASGATVVTGDLVQDAALGLDDATAGALRGRISTIVHAAAFTRFDGPAATAREVNVGGLRNLLHFASECPRLERFVALSTIYVAGRRTGRIAEADLEHECGFVNSYEQSKYNAERLLRAWMPQLPIAVCRLSTVIGESTSGFVAQPRAIHQAIRFLYHSLLPMMPGTPDSPVDLIATEYAAAAVAHLAHQGFVAGGTFHVCAGAEAMRQDALIDLLVQTILESRPAWRRRAIEKPVIVALDTFELFRQSVDAVADSALRASVGVLGHFAPQLAYPKMFDDTDCIAALAPAGITRPAIDQTVTRVVRYLIEHNWGKELPAGAA